MLRLTKSQMSVKSLTPKGSKKQNSFLKRRPRANGIARKYLKITIKKRYRKIKLFYGNVFLFFCLKLMFNF